MIRSIKCFFGYHHILDTPLPVPNCYLFYCVDCKKPLFVEDGL